jgi:hypothetical protein
VKDPRDLRHGDSHRLAYRMLARSGAPCYPSISCIPMRRLR